MKSMMRMEVKVDKRSLADLEKQAKQTPITFRKAISAAVSHAKNSLRKVMNNGGGIGGMAGVPVANAWHSITKQIQYMRKPGGVLAEKRSIVAFKRDGGWIIGWPDAMAGAALQYQSAASYKFEKAQLRYFEKWHVKDVPAWYSRTARPIIEPFASYLDGWFAGEVKSQYDRIVKRRMKKGLGVK
jgi:hypothetical protein